ncbi:uncharacterized protein LOC127740662 [Arachis duranensis]|uniref:Uncharacterized protein LOC127740662 n=1 Tax=Arachis duranensis TaxID=130453 RepID=A0A9C6TCG5_ARADU|nr:uncharacterized protein LOC127740662 [Arachis duranensis]
MAVAEAEVAPRKRLIIKLRLPRSRTVSSEECKLKHDADTEKRAPEFMASDSCGQKRKKDQHFSTTEYWCNVVGKSNAEGSRTLSTDAQCKQKKDDDGADSRGDRKRRKLATSEVSVSTKSSVQEHHNACSRIPRIGSKVLHSKNKKMEEEEHHNACSRIPRTGSKVLDSKNTKKEEEEHHNACSRIPRTGPKVPDSKNKKKEEEEHHNACSRIPRTGSKVPDSKETKKEEEMEVVLNEQRMDRYQKMQCWVILKRFMVGRDGWAFNKTLDPKKLGILGNNCESVSLKPIGFEEIESKLHKFVYSGPDEFANDMRLLFSYGFMYPQRDEIHRVARRFSESFEITWKALKEKWSTEERKRNKIFNVNTKL